MAAMLSAFIGLLSLLSSFSIGLPFMGGGPDSELPLAVGAACLVLGVVGGMLLWQGRRLGLLVMILSFGLPKVSAFMTGAPIRGNLLIAIALFFAATNWKHLR